MENVRLFKTVQPQGNIYRDTPFNEYFTFKVITMIYFLKLSDLNKEKTPSVCCGNIYVFQIGVFNENYFKIFRQLTL